MTLRFDAPSYNAGIEACRSVIDASRQEIEARFGPLLHRREIGEVFGVLSAELAALRIGPNGEPPTLAPVSGGDKPIGGAPAMATIEG